MGSVLYGAAGLFAALASPFLLSLVPFLTVRRGFILAFALLTSVILTLILSIHFENNAGSLTSLIIYSIVVQGMMSPLYWMHVPEITSGASLSLSLSVNFFFGLVSASAGPYLLKNSSED